MFLLLFIFSCVNNRIFGFPSAFAKKSCFLSICSESDVYFVYDLISAFVGGLYLTSKPDVCIFISVTPLISKNHAWNIETAFKTG